MITDDWKNAVIVLKRAAVDFVAAYGVIEDSEYIVEKYPAMRNDRKKLLKKGEIIKNTINSVTKAIDYTYSLYSSIFGTENKTENLQGWLGFGIAGAISVTGLAAATATISAFLMSYKKFKLKLDTIEKLEAKGYSPSQIERIMEEKGTMDFLEYIPYIIGAGIVLFFVPEIKRLVRKI